MRKIRLDATVLRKGTAVQTVPGGKVETAASRLVEEIAAVDGVSRAALMGTSGRVLVDLGFPEGEGLFALHLEGASRGPTLALSRLPGGPDGGVPLLLLVATTAAIDRVASRLEDFSALRLSEADRENAITRSDGLGDSLLEGLDRLLE